MNILKNEESRERLKYREGIIDLLYNADNAYFLTLSPVHEGNISFLKKSLSHLFVLLNERSYGKRYRNKGKYINGVVVTHKSHRHDLHYHIIIRDMYGDLEHRIPMCNALQRVLPKLKRCSYNDRSDLLIGHKSYNIRPYIKDKSRKLEKYITREFENPNKRTQDILDNIGILSIDGVTFGTMN